MNSFVICGLGLIGRQRLQALIQSGVDPQAISWFDPYLKSESIDDFREIKRIDSLEELQGYSPSHVIVSTPHDSAVEITKMFGPKKSKILMEKPMGRNLEEAMDLFDSVDQGQLNIGFNYRFMPAIQALKSDLKSKAIGELISIRIDIGHGGSPKDKDSWKLDPVKAGGGALLDPGIHMIDLLLYLFNGDTSNIEIQGTSQWSGFWDTGIEESISLIGRTSGVPFNISISLVAWRTRFHIEVLGSEGYIIINGRGRTDGPQSYTLGKRWGWQDHRSQIDSEETRVLAITDNSLSEETNAWLVGSEQLATASDGIKGMKLYTSFKEWGN
jgi:predicted dehydrogenase